MTARLLFVTGTDTGVGKTVIACGLVRAFAARGERVAVLKPVASGADRTLQGLRNADALALLQAANVPLTYAEANPYCFEPAVSPHIAAKDARIEVDIGTIAAGLERLRGRSDRVVIEGAGGWLAPINEDETMADLARALKSPALMVVGLRLGCLNHAQLTRQAIDAAQVPFAGWIANRMGPAMEREAENLATLERRLGEPALAIVPHAAGGASALVLTDAAARLAATG